MQGSARRLCAALAPATVRQPDVDKARALSELFQVPAEARSDHWFVRFYDGVGDAALLLNEREPLSRGPDGFPYVHLLLPPSGAGADSLGPLQSFSTLKADGAFLGRGAGYTLSREPGAIDWVFSYGDALNYYLSDTFHSDELPTSLTKGHDLIPTDAEFLIGDPSEEYFPWESRQIVREFLASNGARSPRVGVISRWGGEEGPTQELAFILDSIPDELVCECVGWYLPRHYSIVFVKKSDVRGGFDL